MDVQINPARPFEDVDDVQDTIEICRNSDQILTGTLEPVRGASGL